MSQIGPYTSPDGKTQGYFDSMTSSYVMEDSTVVPDGQFSGFYTWWASDPAVPAAYSVTVDIITLNDDPTWQSEAGVYTRLESDSQGPYAATYTWFGMDGTLGSDYVGPSGSSELVARVQPSAFQPGRGAVNRLKVMVKDDHAWVYLNNQLMNDFALDARTDVGATGFAFVLSRYGNAVGTTKYGFRNLTIRAVQ